MLLSYANSYLGYGYGRGGYYFDWTYLLVLAGLILSLLAQGKVKSTFAKYSRVRSMSGLTGAQAAQRVLHSAGIYDVSIQRVSGNLTDHYDPRSKVLRLSDSTYGSDSVAAVGVAAHECGHAIQHQKGYGPLVLRSTLVPAANIGSQLSWPIFFAGLIFSIRPLLTAGILLFGLAVLFQLVTLPVEINASRRAVTILGETGLVTEKESSGVKKVLTAAALTYVAALASSILQLLRLIILAGGRRRDD
ncbi:MAG: zinc metallopeptidase [Candidatus Limivivens sp.]|nr:zinc metallopeptidase [Candidatus Limivivens sp.]